MICNISFWYGYIYTAKGKRQKIHLLNVQVRLPLKSASPLKKHVFTPSLKGKLFKTKFVLDFTQTLAKISIEIQLILTRKLWIGQDEHPPNLPHPFGFYPM